MFESRSNEGFVLSIFHDIAFLHSQDPKATFGIRGIEGGEPPEVPFGIDPKAEQSVLNGKYALVDAGPHRSTRCSPDIHGA